MKTWYVFSLVGLFTSLFAQTPLPPQQTASLYDHLLEINREWAQYPVPETWKNTPVRFEDDIARIQRHLQLVSSILEQRMTTHLSATQASHRERLLAALKAYHEAGRFPINTRHNYRIPYFIDDYGTACAVGHLLIQSGQESFARQIREEMNYAYIAEMPYEALGIWANEQGFTGDELAWIQPGYLPADPFTRMGTGTNGPVSAMVADTANDRVFIAGDFNEVNGMACNRIAGWDGNQFFALGEGLEGDAKALVVYEGSLYAGGTFTGPVGDLYNLAVWNGVTWSLTNVFQGVVMDFHVHEGTLYAAGSFGIAGTASFIYFNVAKWESGSWVNVGTGTFDGAVRALASFQGDLVAGGEFQTYNGDSLSYVARYHNGDWTALGAGLDNGVLTLLAHADTLYAGGRFFDALQQPAFGLARIDTAGWKQLIDPTDYIPSGDSTYIQYIATLHLHPAATGMELYAAGYFSICPLVGYYGENIGRITQEPSGTFSLIALASPDSTVSTLTSGPNGDLFMGGYFEGHLSKTGTPFTRLNPALRTPRLAMYPNPVSGSASIDLETIAWKPDMRLRILNAVGQEVKVSYTHYHQTLELRAGDLPRGAYFFELIHDRQRLGQGRFVVQ